MLVCSPLFLFYRKDGLWFPLLLPRQPHLQSNQNLGSVARKDWFASRVTNKAWFKDRANSQSRHQKDIPDETLISHPNFWPQIKSKTGIAYVPAISLLGIYPKKHETLFWKIYPPLCSLKHYLQSPRSRSSHVSISRWMDKTAVGHVHNGILLSHKNEENFTLCDSMDGPGGQYAKWNKSIRERQISYDFTYMWNLMNKVS